MTKRATLTITVRVEFKVKGVKDVEYSVYFQATDMAIYDFIAEMAPFHQKLGNRVIFTPHYFTK